MTTCYCVNDHVHKIFLDRGTANAMHKKKNATSDQDVAVWHGLPPKSWSPHKHKNLSLQYVSTVISGNW